jgi:hypothetical protein
VLYLPKGDIVTDIAKDAVSSHDGHPIPEPEVQGRAAVEGELPFRGARKHVSSDAGSLDSERLDSGRGEKFGTCHRLERMFQFTASS